MYIGNQPISTAFVTDTFSGNSSTTVFTMSVAPASTSSIIVAITGVLQDPSTYSVSGTTLTFSAAPPTGTGNISVRYLGIPASGVTTTAYRTVTEFTATAGQTSFSVPSYTVGYINVYRNGVRLGTADFTATTGTTVVLAAGATVGDLVTTESFYVSSVLNAIPATAGAVNSTYITDSAVLTAKIADANVTQAKLAAGVAGNGPAFSAYMNANQTVTQSTYTKIQFNTEEYDTNSNYDTSTYRFTPTVAGYYAVNACATVSSAQTYNQLTIYKNGSLSRQGAISAASGSYVFTVNATVYLNGSTDYIEIYGQTTGASPTFTAATALSSYFQAVLVRAA